MNQSGKIFSLIPKIMSEVGAITKDRTNSAPGASYRFRGIDDVYAAFQPLLSKYGVFCVPKVLHTKREERLSANGKTLIYTILEVEFRFYADDGSSFEAVTTGEAMDTSDKSCNKAMSAAMKVAFLQVFCVPTEDDNDTENHTHEPRPKAAMDGPRPQASVLTLKSSGAFCDLCATELILSKAGSGYYCPKFKEPGGEHTRFPADQLQGVINQQNQNRAGVPD